MLVLLFRAVEKKARNVSNYYNDDQSKPSYSYSINFKDSIPPVIITKILTSITRNIFKYATSTPFSFIIEQDNNFTYFYSNNKLYKFNINSKSINYVELNLDDKSILGNITIDENNVILTFSNREIKIFTHDLKLIKEKPHKYGIVSKPMIFDNKLYFIDLSDSIVEYDLKKDRFKSFTPDVLGKNFDNCIDNFIITEDYIIYGTSVSCVYVIDRKTFNLAKTIKLNAQMLYIKNKPLIYKDILYLTSDSETIAVSMLDFEILWKIKQGSFTQHIIITEDSKDYLILGDLNYMYTYKLYDLQKPMKEDEKSKCKNPKNISEIFFGNNNFLMSIFTYDEKIFAMDSVGNIHLVDILRCNFKKCIDNLITKHTPAIKIIDKRCIILLMNIYGELEIYNLTLLKNISDISKRGIL